MMFCVYGIKSRKRERIYIGQTCDLEERLKVHNSGSVRSSKKDLPWDLIAIEKCETRGSARWLEFQLKKSKGKRLRWLKRYSTELRTGGGLKGDTKRTNVRKASGS